MGVCLNSQARRFKTSPRCFNPASSRCGGFTHQQPLRGIDNVIRRQAKCRYRPSLPTASATLVVKAMTSCLTSRSISRMRSTSNFAFLRMAQVRRTRGNQAGLRLYLGCGDFDVQPFLKPVFVVQMRPISGRV